MKIAEPKKPFNILLADDDVDDRLLFAKALQEIEIYTNLVTVNNGETLMNYLLNEDIQLPHAIFLDLSMPGKTGFECLAEIKEKNKLNNLPIIMYTTSCTRPINFEDDLKKTLGKMGAQNYIRKPNDFEELKKIIHQSLIKIIEEVEFEPKENM